MGLNAFARNLKMQAYIKYQFGTCVKTEMGYSAESFTCICRMNLERLVSSPCSSQPNPCSFWFRQKVYITFSWISKTLCDVLILEEWRPASRNERTKGISLLWSVGMERQSRFSPPSSESCSVFNLPWSKLFHTGRRECWFWFLLAKSSRRKNGLWAKSLQRVEWNFMREEVPCCGYVLCIGKGPPRFLLTPFQSHSKIPTIGHHGSHCSWADCRNGK